LTDVDVKLKVWIRTRWLHFRDEIAGNLITPLRWAIARDKPALVQALLEAGAEFPKIPDKNTAKRTQLAKSGPSEHCDVFELDQPCYNIRIIRAFLDRHGLQKGQAPFAETPLGLMAMDPDGPARRMRMVNYSHPDTLSSLLSLLRQYQSIDDAVLFWAAVVNNNEDIVRYLVRNGVDVELRYQGMTPLHTAILHSRVNIFEFLLENGTDAGATTSKRRLSTLRMLFWTVKPRKTESMMLDILLHHLGGSIVPYCHTRPSILWLARYTWLL
jgi:ankyrin repeat protein